MRKLVAPMLVLAGLSGTAAAQNYVRGHYRSNGTYVNPYYRSHADFTPLNNWSTHPNVNPYTGKTGTHHYYGYRSYR